MKPFKFVSESFRNIIWQITGDESPIIKHDSDGKNAVVYSHGKSVFFPVRREYQPESEEMFLWQILFPAESVPGVYFRQESIDDKIIWVGKSPKGQLIYWLDNDTSSGIFFSEFDLGGKLFWERVLPCDEELVKISQEIVRE